MNNIYINLYENSTNYCKYIRVAIIIINNNTMYKLSKNIALTFNHVLHDINVIDITTWYTLYTIIQMIKNLVKNEELL